MQKPKTIVAAVRDFKAASPGFAGAESAYPFTAAPLPRGACGQTVLVTSRPEPHSCRRGLWPDRPSSLAVPSRASFTEPCARTALCQLLLAAASKGEVQSVAAVAVGAAGAWGQHLEIPLGKFLRFARLHGYNPVAQKQQPLT